jgi:hypothetical protein
MSKNALNIEQLIVVAENLKDLKDQVVFVGGSTTALLVDSVASESARQTEDVDFIVDISVMGDMLRFENKMRKLGFVNDTSEGAPICRWLMKFNGNFLKVDAMPTGENIFGFTNRWYAGSIESAWTKEVKKGLAIKVIDPVYFLGTKFEAYKGRGNRELFSHDIEDIMYVLEHRSEIEKDVRGADSHIKAYLSLEFAELLNHPDLENTLPGLLDNVSSVDIVMGKMDVMASGV